MTVRAEISFSLPDEEKGPGYLGSLSRMVIVLGAEQAKHKTIPLRIDCEVQAIHEEIEETLITRVSHNGNLAREAFCFLKEYWRVEKSRQ